ncbi:PPC domain-containing protein [Haloarcula marina]|uniref:PPC domain-containing protein n=1 Tax=Haloarcula marina TaxID=2961574 RepID=UPI0020B7417B|nr:PPC domain-containing protein [Halomicroarcula marina]
MGDPQNENGYYEPVQFAAEANTSVNITMGAQNGDPQIRLLAPNGSTIAINDDGAYKGNGAVLRGIRLPVAGSYTIIAGSSKSNATFEYILTIEEYSAPIDETSPENWNKREKLDEFARDYRKVANSTDNHTQITNQTVYPDQNYISLTYKRRPENTTDLQNTQVSILLTYSNLGDVYRNESSDPFDKSFIPERIFFRAETTDGELYRTAYLTDDWVREYSRTDDFETYWYKFLYATRWGPAHESYVEGADNSTSVGLAVYDEYNSSAK